MSGEVFSACPLIYVGLSSFIRTSVYNLFPDDPNKNKKETIGSKQSKTTAPCIDRSAKFWYEDAYTSHTHQEDVTVHTTLGHILARAAPVQNHMIPVNMAKTVERLEHLLELVWERTWPYLG